jgi:hypothetical protein
MSKASELDQAVKRYIISTIQEDAEANNQTPIEYIRSRFESEYGWRIKQAGRQTAMIDWLQGLAIPIAFSYFDILTLAKQWGSLPTPAAVKQEDKILDNYCRFMAAKTLQLLDGYRVPKPEAKTCNHIFLRANSIEGVRIAEMMDYPDAGIMDPADFLEDLRTTGEDDIFTFVLPAGTDGTYEKINNEYGIH